MANGAEGNLEIDISKKLLERYPDAKYTYVGLAEFLYEKYRWLFVGTIVPTEKKLRKVIETIDKMWLVSRGGDRKEN